MTLRDHVIRLLHAALADEPGLRALLHGWQPHIAGEVVDVIEAALPALADDLLGSGTLAMFLDDVEATLPALEPEVAEVRAAADLDEEVRLRRPWRDGAGTRLEGPGPSAVRGPRRLTVKGVSPRGEPGRGGGAGIGGGAGLGGGTRFDGFHAVVPESYVPTAGEGPDESPFGVDIASGLDGPAFVEPIIEPIVEPIVEPIIEPIVEPIVEPIIEHGLEPLAQPHPSPPPPPAGVDPAPIAPGPPGLPDLPGGSSPGLPKPLDPTPRLPPQLVNLGFAAPDAPATPLLDRTLATDRAYVFWVEIGATAIAGSLPGARPLERVAHDDVLDVIVFGFPGQLAIEEPRRARVRLGAGGTTIVSGPAIPGAGARLGFPIRTPARPGKHALRCNVYGRGVLLQSHLVTATVETAEAPRPSALVRDLDYNLTSDLDANRVAAGCKLSLFANDDGHGTHSFRFVSSNDGVPDQIREAHLEGTTLRKMVEVARGALRRAAWGTSAPWTRTDAYRFRGPFDRKLLSDALVDLARAGADLYMELASDLDFGNVAANPMRAHMRAPGRVQIALKRDPDAVIPAALIYDHPVDGARRVLTVCDDALAAIAGQRALADEPCFRGECPRYDDRGVVCPGGFWGFRHAIGFPIHLRPPHQVTAAIPRGPAVRGFAPISLDPGFKLRDAHLDRLGRLAPGWLEILDSREEVLDRLREDRHVVYFYCHGGLTTADKVFLSVGPLDSDYLIAQSFFEANIAWSALRPLVILNGCHTTAVSPETLFSLVSAFADRANAAGVIGTEITNFEPIAVAFGDTFVPLFLGGAPVGEAVRAARLELLRQGNPLGLMYIPFALPDLHLA